MIPLLTGQCQARGKVGQTGARQRVAAALPRLTPQATAGARHSFCSHSIIPRLQACHQLQGRQCPPPLAPGQQPWGRAWPAAERSLCSVPLVLTKPEAVGPVITQ